MMILAGLLSAGMVGCQGGSMGSVRRSAAKPEPALTASGDDGSGTVISKSPPPAVGFVDRHPLFYKPREIYNNSGSNRVVKVAGAAIVGVPMGLAGELRQIVVGAPAEPRPAF
jgi:hypothetical protein